MQCTDGIALLHQSQVPMPDMVWVRRAGVNQQQLKYAQSWINSMIDETIGSQAAHSRHFPLQSHNRTNCPKPNIPVSTSWKQITSASACFRTFLSTGALSGHLSMTPRMLKLRIVTSVAAPALADNMARFAALLPACQRRTPFPATPNARPATTAPLSPAKTVTEDKCSTPPSTAALMPAAGSALTVLAQSSLRRLNTPLRGLCWR